MRFGPFRITRSRRSLALTYGILKFAGVVSIVPAECYFDRKNSGSIFVVITVAGWAFGVGWPN